MLGIAFQEAGGDLVLQVTGHRLARASPGLHEVRIPFLVGLVQVEHQLVGVRMIEGEIQIGLANGDALGANAARRRARRLQGVGEAVEAVCANGGEDIVLVLEIAVGRHRRDAEVGRQLAHSHRIRAPLGEQPLGGLAEPLAEIGDISVGKNPGHIDSNNDMNTLAICHRLRNKFTS